MLLFVFVARVVNFYGSLLLYEHLLLFSWVRKILFLGLVRQSAIKECFFQTFSIFRMMDVSVLLKTFSGPECFHSLPQIQGHLTLIPLVFFFFFLSILPFGLSKINEISFHSTRWRIAKKCQHLTFICFPQHPTLYKLEKKKRNSNLYKVLKAFSQPCTSHSKGFSLVWTRTWILRLYEVRKAFPQPCWLHTNVYSPLCVFWWVRRFPAVL